MTDETASGRADKSSIATRHCSSCGNEIEPGQRRVPSSAGPIHEMCKLRERIRDSFNFYINNPRNVPNVGFSLWVESGGEEFPVLYNTSGMTIVGSASTSVGDAIEPSEPFIDAIAYTHHTLMCFMSGGVDPEVVEDELDMWYDGRVPKHEEWAIHHILGHLHPPGKIIPEFAELREYVDGCTQWGTPEVMGADDAE